MLFRTLEIKYKIIIIILCLLLCGETGCRSRYNNSLLADIRHKVERRVAYSVLVENFEGKRPLKRPRCRREDNTKMDFQEVGWDMDWIDLARDKNRWLVLVNGVMNIQVS